MSAAAQSQSPATDTPVLLCEDHNGVSRLTLNRPRQFNALSSQLLAELQQQLDALAGREDIQVVIIAANGKGFCGGHDLKEMRSTADRAFHQTLFEQCSRMMLTINAMPQPVIAQVNGIATAAGCQLVGACDLAIAAEDARFAVNGINQGLFCSTPSVALSRNVSRKQAMAMLLTGEFIDAETAYRYGLINQVVAPAGLAAATDALAGSICAKSSLAVRTGKRMFYRQLALDLPAAYAYAAETMACNMDSEDAREGVDAFFAKREPVWQGR